MKLIFSSFFLSNRKKIIQLIPFLKQKTQNKRDQRYSIDLNKLKRINKQKIPFQIFPQVVELN